MADVHSLGPWLRRFLEEYLVSERNLLATPNSATATRRHCCYRSSLETFGKPVDRLAVRDLSGERVRLHWRTSKIDAGCSARTPTSASPPSAPLRAMWPAGALNTSNGAAESAPSRSRRLASASRLPRETRTGRLARRPGHFHRARPSRAGDASFSLSPGARASEAAQLKVGRATGREYPGPITRPVARQGRQDTPVPVA